MLKLDILKESVLKNLNTSSESLESIGKGIEHFFERAVPSLPNLGLNVLLSVGLITLFLTLFFFTYVKYVEKKIVIKNVNYLVDSMGDSVIPILPQDIKNLIYSTLTSYRLADMKDIDKQVNDSNKVLLNKTIKIQTIIIVIIVILSFALCFYYNLNFSEILITNIFLLFSVMITEYMFLNNVIFNWISANPNIVKQQIIKSIIDNN